MIMIRFRFKNKIYDKSFTKPFEKGGLYGHVDIPRITEGKYGGAFWSAFMPCPRNVTDYSNESYAPSK
jgi:membrane dipeptidase